MKNLLIIPIALMFFGCSGMHLKANDPWTNEQKILQGTSLALRVADWGTTLDIADKPDKYREVNPILGDHPSKGRVNTFFASSIILNYLIADNLPGKYRNKWLWFNVAVSAICVGNNYGIGLRMKF